MNFIALLLVAFALFANLKAYPNVFMSKKKRAEQEEKFKEAMDKIGDSPIGKGMTKGVVGASMYISAFLNFLFYLITSVVVNNPIMYALAVVIFLLNTVAMKTGMKNITEKKFKMSVANKFSLPLKTAYIIGFIFLFFI